MIKCVYTFRVDTEDLKMMSDASDMLAAALEQMDGIIAGNYTEPFQLHGMTGRMWISRFVQWTFNNDLHLQFWKSFEKFGSVAL